MASAPPGPPGGARQLSGRTICPACLTWRTAGPFGVPQARVPLGAALNRSLRGPAQLAAAGFQLDAPLPRGSGGGRIRAGLGGQLLLSPILYHGLQLLPLLAEFLAASPVAAATVVVPVWQIQWLVVSAYEPQAMSLRVLPPGQLHRPQQQQRASCMGGAWLRDYRCCPGLLDPPLDFSGGGEDLQRQPISGHHQRGLRGGGPGPGADDLQPSTGAAGWAVSFHFARQRACQGSPLYSLPVCALLCRQLAARSAGA